MTLRTHVNGVESNGNAREVEVWPGVSVHPDDPLPVTAPLQLRRWVYRVWGDKRTFVAYAPGPIEALELIEKANLDLALSMDHLREETEEEGRKWEEETLASRSGRQF